MVPNTTMLAVIPVQCENLKIYITHSQNGKQI